MNRLGDTAWAPSSYRSVGIPRDPFDAINDALTRGCCRRRFEAHIDPSGCACTRKIFGWFGAAALLEKITTDDVRWSKLESLIENHVRKLETKMEKMLSGVVRASLVAVLQSPLHGKRPALLKLKKGGPLPRTRPLLP